MVYLASSLNLMNAPNHGFYTFAKHLPHDLSCANRRGTTCENTLEVHNGGRVCLRGM